MLEKGQRFQIRDSKSTIGSGVVINLLPDLSDKEVEELWDQNFFLFLKTKIIT